MHSPIFILHCLCFEGGSLFFKWVEHTSNLSGFGHYSQVSLSLWPFGSQTHKPLQLRGGWPGKAIVRSGVETLRTDGHFCVCSIGDHWKKRRVCLAGFFFTFSFPQESLRIRQRLDSGAYFAATKVDFQRSQAWAVKTGPPFLVVKAICHQP